MNHFIEFENRVANICVEAFEHATNLCEGLQACEGLFPTLTIPKFMEIDRNLTERWIEQAASQMREQEIGERKYAASFFLSTWEFCDTEVRNVAEFIMNSNWRTCLLGVPSLVPFLSVTNESLPHVLVDLRVPQSESTKNVICMQNDINTLKGHELSEAFDLCVLDPPWYVENYKKWIDIAGAYCREGGIIAFVLLGRLTRPTADSDRKTLLRYCRARGLNMKIIKNAVLYDTPTFERSMLLRAGIPPVPWKRADLAIATRNGWNFCRRNTPTPEPIIPFGQSSAFGVLMDVVFDRYETNSKELILWPSGGFWMETPSQRVLSTKKCNVFTSNGAKFISPRPIDLFAELTALENCDQSFKLEQLVRLGFPSSVFGDFDGAPKY